MIKQIVSGYVGIFRGIFRIAVLLAICIGAGALIAWPLWKLATVDPSLYTLIFGTLVVALAVFLVLAHCRKSFRKNRRTFIFRMASILVLAAGFIGAILLVFAWERVLAAVTIVITFALYGFLAFGLAPDRHHAAL